MGTGKDCFAATRRLRAALLTSSALALAWTLPATPARAQDATWLASPGSNIYNTGTNWSTGSVPTGTAYFGTSSQTNLTLATAVSVGRWYFDTGASSYTFNIPNGSGLSFTDGGMVLWGGSSTINNSGGLNFYNSSVSQGTIINNDFLTYWGMSAAGHGTITNNYILSFNGNTFSGGTTIINNHLMAYQENSFAGGGTSLTNNSHLEFRNTTRAGAGSSITNSAGADLYFQASSRAEGSTIANSGNLYFSDGSTAGSAFITNNSQLYFNDASKAGSATITNTAGAYLNFNNSALAEGGSITNNAGANLNFNNTSSAGSASITNNGLLYFNDTSTAGSAAITNSAGATVNFNNTSSSGSASITNNGLLYFNDTSTAGSAAITNNAGVSVNFNNGSSAGSATITNDGLLKFNDTSTAGSAAIINGAIADFSPRVGPNSDNKLSVGSIAGAGQYFLGANELTVGSNNLSTTVTGVIADGGSAGGAGGSLVKVGTGVLALAGSNSYTGGTTITAGTLQLGDGGTTGSVVSNIVDNGVLAFNRSDVVTFTNVVSGNGAVQQIGSGTTILTADMSYAGGTTITAGTLQIGNGGTSGSILGNVVNDSVLVFDRSDTITFAGDISGSGAVQKLGSNTAILTGANSYTGVTTIAAGTLQIGNGGTTGSIAGNVVNDGVLTIDRSDVVALPGDISGSGSLRQAGAGTTILTGSNSYTGGTTIAAGTLQIGNGGTTGSIVGDVANDGVLAFNRSNTLTLAVNISGSGSVQQIGSGTTILTGTNTYSGDTTVSGGRLQFGDGGASGSTNLAGNVNVTGGTLAIQSPANLNVAQTVTFGNNTALSIVAGANSPALSADGVAIGSGVTFNVSGINDASQLDKVLIDTQSGISGDFANVTIGGFSGTVDYLTMSVRKSANGLQYLATYGLSWTAGNSLAHGTFTLTNAGDSFTVGAALTDQAANPATGWDGKSLTKAGAGTLILTGQNTYSGGTTVSGGTLQIGSGGATGSILDTVTVNSGATFEVVNADTSGITNLANGGLTNFRNSSSAGNASIANTGQLNFHDTSTGGTATITNDGNLTFNNSSSAGSAAITNNSNLHFWHTASAGSSSITNHAALEFNNTATAGSALIDNLGTTNFNDTSSAGTAAINNTGVSLAFNGSSTAGGASIFNSVDLNFNNSASAGTAAITNTGTIEFKDVATAANAQITTTGLTNFRNTSSAGNATLTINGNFVNFYNTSTAGNATINVGTANLWFRDTSSAGNATIVNNGGLVTANSATLGNATITNNMGLFLDDSSSAGNAVITNHERIYFYDSSTAGTATIVNNDSLNFWGDSSAGSARITNAAAGTLEIVNSGTLANATVVNSGQMSFWGGNPGDVPTAGNATITNNASGTIEFRNSGTAGSARIANAGTIILSDSSTAGTASITNDNQLTFYGNTTAGSAVITNKGTVLFDGNSTPDNAQLINNAPGAVVNFFTPGPNGDGKISAGSIAGSGRFDLNSIELTVGGNNLSTTVAGVLTGDGIATGKSLVKVGTGTMTLAGLNSYTGATIVDAGALVVNGSIAASSGVTVNSGATLGGGGAVGNTIVNSGGTLMAGNGTANSSLTVAGSLALQSGAAYMVQIDPATSSSVNVSGTATLGGATLRAVYANGSYVTKQYTILTAGSVNGTFGSFVQTNLPSNFHTELSYDATHAYLSLILDFVAPPGRGLAGNQQNVGNAIINSFNANGGISLVYSRLTSAGLTQASGETAAGAQQTTFQAMGQFMGLFTDPSGAGRDAGVSAPPAYADSAPAGAARDAFAMLAKAPTFEQRWNVWVAGFGGSQTTDGNTAQGSNSATSRLFGTAAGAEYWFSPQTMAGFALAGGGTSFSVVNGGTGRSDLFQAGAYVRHNNGPSYISAALAYGWQDVTTDRTVTLAGVDRLRAEFNANAWSGRVESGYRFVAPWIGGIGLTPYAAGQFTTFNLPGYTESVVSGSNAFALAYAAKSVTDSRSELGLRTDKSFAMQDGVLTLRGRAAWAHDFNPDRSVTSTFQALPGASFVVSGARPAADSALATASAEMKWLNGWSMAASFEGEFSNVTRSYAGKGTVRYAW